MRAGLFKPGILIHEGTFFGFCLGADYVAEHEQGLGDLRSYFGISQSTEPLGVKNLQFTKLPSDEMIFFKKGQSAYLLFSRMVGYGKKDPEKFQADFHRRPNELYLRGEEKMAGAWSDRDFGIMVKGKEAIAQLQELWDAMQKKDVAFGFTSAMPAFDNAGLCIFIVSKFPKVFNDSLIAQQVEKNRLQAAADKTGVIAYLESKGKGLYKGYFACRPEFDDKTEDGLRWWFNSYNQQEDGYGWMTSQDLRDYADGKEGNKISKHGYAHQKKG
jgi:hypothetical protein